MHRALWASSTSPLQSCGQAGWGGLCDFSPSGPWFKILSHWFLEPQTEGCFCLGLFLLLLCVCVCLSVFSLPACLSASLSCSLLSGPLFSAKGSKQISMSVSVRARRRTHSPTSGPFWVLRCTISHSKVSYSVGRWPRDTGCHPDPSEVAPGQESNQQVPPQPQKRFSEASTAWSSLSFLTPCRQTLPVQIPSETVPVGQRPSAHGASCDLW